MSGRYPNTSQHLATPFTRMTVSHADYEKTLTAIGEQFDQVVLEEVYELLPADAACGCDGEIEPMEAARLIAGEMYANAVQREIATPCETAEGTRLLREYRIATRHRADAAAKMLEAASLYAYEAFGNARAERDYQDQTLSILRGKLRDLGIDGGAL